MIEAGTFQLDERLEADTLVVTDFEVCTCRLMNDKRWPWLILVPRKANAEELFDLSPSQQETAMREASVAGEKLKALTSCSKINIAMIGNIVRQLHIHVVARMDGDENWPGPVWGYGQQEEYSTDHARGLIAHFKEIL